MITSFVIAPQHKEFAHDGRECYWRLCVEIRKYVGQDLKKFLIGIVVLGVLGFVALVLADQIAWGTWRYKITIEIDTPEGIKSGSAVREVRAFARPGLPGEPGNKFVSYEVIGEAVAVDLDAKGILFQLPDYEIFLKAFHSPSNERIQKIRYFNSLANGTVVSVNPDETSFVIFLDRSNPQSIRTVSAKDVGDILGGGIKMKGILIEKTTKSVTWGRVQEALEWFGTKPMGLNFEEIERLRVNKIVKDKALFYKEYSFIKGGK